jgi:S-adenosylmethionine hydrolase
VPDPQVGRSQISATVLPVDRFGNVATNARRRHLTASASPTAIVEIRLTLDRYYALVAGTFADALPGELIVYEDSYGLVTLRSAKAMPPG